MEVGISSKPENTYRSKLGIPGVWFSNGSQ